MEINTIQQTLDNLQGKKLTLDYERQMFLDIVNSNALLIAAKGIHYDTVVASLLNAYSSSANLIFVINFSDWEEEYYKSQLDAKYVREIPTTGEERENFYLKGGVQFITTRILIVDLLKKRVPVELITGIVVLRAHTIMESSQVAFALQLYRKENKEGFVKAFSSSAESFNLGFASLERSMRNLFTNEVYLWPRFHETVKCSLRPHESKTLELHIDMTPKMKSMQNHILDIIKHLVREIKRLNAALDLSELTEETCISKNFHKILHAQLDRVWHQLDPQSKRIIADLKILRNLMIATVYNDAVNLYALLKRYRTKEYAMSNSGWTVLDAAEHMFTLAKERVYNKDCEFAPEHCPKWQALLEVLNVEIHNDMEQSFDKNDVHAKNVLILCRDKRSCYQLKQLLTEGGERYLLYEAVQHELPIGKLSTSFEKIKTSQKIKPSQKGPKESSVPETEITNDSEGLEQVLSEENTEVEEHALDSYMLSMTFQQNDLNGTQFDTCPELDMLDITATVAAAKQPLIYIQTFKTQREGPMAVDRLLHELQPQYVIMYHCNMTLIRQLEVFEARRSCPANQRMRIFFLMHARTVEEQSYLTDLRREKNAFEHLILTKANMAKNEALFDLSIQNEMNAENTNENEKTRQAGGQAAEALQPGIRKQGSRIIVDMREFRSDLPCIIHKRGIEVIPLTITIGDYILSPQYCVERKSISDLIGSLNTGRLYNQCLQMQRFYEKPVLLIEFEANMPFTLQVKKNSLHYNASVSHVREKLQLLTIYFPKLRLIWSPSPYATAQFFDDMKMGKEEPDPKKATSLGAEGESGAFDELKYNANIYDFLLRLPGINSKNIHKLMLHGGSLKQLLKKTEEEIIDLLGTQEQGKMFWAALHNNYQPKDEKSTTVAGLTKKLKGSRFGRFVPDQNKNTKK